MTADDISEIAFADDWTLWVRSDDDQSYWRIKVFGMKSVCQGFAMCLKKSLEWVILPPGERPILSEVGEEYEHGGES